MKPEDLEVLRLLVHARSGLIVDPAKPYLIESRLAPVARKEGFDSIADLIEAIKTRRDDRLMWAITEAMAHTETSFFRDRTPFDMFKDDMLPALAARRQGEPIRVWSAACSTGQEVYSLAMAWEEARSRLPGANLELFASDLSQTCLEKAQAGFYTQPEVQRGLPIRMLLNHFGHTGELWRISPQIRQMIRWRRVNLLANLESLGRFDVIFCRYAINQFDEPLRKHVLDQLSKILADDGYLVLGVPEGAEAAMGLSAIPGRPGVFVRAQAVQAVA